MGKRTHNDGDSSVRRKRKGVSRGEGRISLAMSAKKRAKSRGEQRRLGDWDPDN